MKYMVLAWDVPGAEGVARRDALRPAHSDAITARFHAGSVILGAGIYDEAGVVRGSLLVMDCPDRAGVDEYVESEPFQTGGLWERVEIRELRLPDMYLEGLGRPPA